MKEYKATTRFRKQLKDRLPIWQTDGIIDSNHADALSQRYRLDQLTGESMRTLLSVIYTIGVSLIGVGIISFVAFHWSGMPKTLKLTLIIAAMLISHLTGFYLWKISAKSPKLGHALILLGTLIFGANIGLIAQMFHIKSDPEGMFLPWAIGAIVMAYALNSVPNAAVAVITSFIWFMGKHSWWSYDYNSIWYYPWIAAAVFLTFAYSRRSTLIWVMTLLCLGITFPMSVSGDFNEALRTLIAIISVGVLFYSWGVILHKTQQPGLSATWAMLIGTAWILWMLFMSSFYDVADDFAEKIDFSTDMSFREFGSVAALLLTTLFFAAIAVIRSQKNKTVLVVSTALLASSALVIVTALFALPFALVVFANIAMLAIAAALIWASSKTEDRRLFWSGVFIAVVMIVARTLEYDTSLLLKSAAFTACGIALMTAGIMFEKFLKKRQIEDE